MLNGPSPIPTHETRVLPERGICYLVGTLPDGRGDGYDL